MKCAEDTVVYQIFCFFIGLLLIISTVGFSHLNQGKGTGNQTCFSSFPGERRNGEVGGAVRFVSRLIDGGDRPGGLNQYFDSLRVKLSCFPRIAIPREIRLVASRYPSLSTPFIRFFNVF
jgi:hypothetical protein